MRGCWQKAWRRFPVCSSTRRRSRPNIVIFHVEDARALVARIADRVEVQAFDAHRVRAVTHLDVSREDVERALEAFADELG